MLHPLDMTLVAVGQLGERVGRCPNMDKRLPTRWMNCLRGLGAELAESAEWADWTKPTIGYQGVSAINRLSAFC